MLMSILMRSGSGAEWPPKQSEETSSMKKALQLLWIGMSFFGCDLHKQASYYSQWMWHHVTFSLAYFSLPLSWLLIEFKCFFTLSTVLAFRKSASCCKCWRDKQGISHNSRLHAQWFLHLQGILVQMRASDLNLTKYSRLAYGSIPSCLRTTCSTNICRTRISCHFILHTTREEWKTNVFKSSLFKEQSSSGHMLPEVSESTTALCWEWPW